MRTLWKSLTAGRSKYGNKRVEVDGHKFHSRKEAQRYLVLRDMLKRGEISDLKLQYPFKITINDKHICTYYADFVYADCRTEKTHGMRVITVEDVKGMRTDLYKLKKKLVEAQYKLEVREV